jgi:hypothetical protein
MSLLHNEIFLKIVMYSFIIGGGLLIADFGEIIIEQKRRIYDIGV